MSKRRHSDSDSDSDDSNGSSSSSDSSSPERERTKKRRKKEKKKKEKKKKKDKKKEKKKKKDKKKKKKKKTKKKDIFDRPEEKVDDVVGQVKLLKQDKLGFIEKKILKLGAGRRPERGNEMELQVTGYIKTGKRTKYWSTKDKYEKPYKFRVGIGRVIKGWDEGCMTMRKGERAELTVTGAFGYGVEGNRKLNIPGMAILLLDVEVLNISDDVHVPTNEELMKQRMKNKTVFIDRTGDRPNPYSTFNAAPF